MAEAMKGLKRTHRCTELSAKNVGETVTVMGWVQKSRNKGGIIFVDLRDRSGILQLIFEESDVQKEGFEKAEKLRSEFVIAVVGTVEKRNRYFCHGYRQRSFRQRDSSANHVLPTDCARGPDGGTHRNRIQRNAG